MKEAVEKSKSNLRLALAEPYLKGLQEYLSGGGEDALGRGYEFGRTALTDGHSILEILHVHHIALKRLLEDARGPEAASAVLRDAGTFLAEVLAPYEMTHRGFREAVTALRHLNEMLELEVKRIAQALHDEAGQLLIAVHLALADLDRDLPPAFHDRVGNVKSLLDEIDGQLRRLSHELRPTILDDLGLVPALEFLAEGVSKRTKQAIFVHASLKDRLPTTVEIALYRIVQEALTNAAKHSRAGNVHIQLDRSAGQVRCLIHDDGTGFDVPTVLDRKGDCGLGLLGIQERLNAMGGTLHIQSSLGRGTKLLIKVPVEG
ncbi:MAG TPA: ATP-binding protein [Candidatus Acidoferrales bacterium]|nr:ATP-binding protein [Candidatus Acidoferrales bacterium]